MNRVVGRKIGYFGGSFDPIHLGHLHLAIELFERHHLDEILFCPTSQSPYKTHSPPLASKEERRAMVTAAISPLPQFTLLDMELQKQDPCYTIDTLELLLDSDRASNAPKKHYFLLLGEDQLENFHQWKEVELLLTKTSPLIGSRDHSHKKSLDHFSGKMLSKIKKGMTPIPTLEISSSEIRKRIKASLYCGHLLPVKVWDYIVNQCQAYR